MIYHVSKYLFLLFISFQLPCIISIINAVWAELPFIVFIPEHLGLRGENSRCYKIIRRPLRVDRPYLIVPVPEPCSISEWRHIVHDCRCDMVDLHLRKPVRIIPDRSATGKNIVDFTFSVVLYLRRMNRMGIVTEDFHTIDIIVSRIHLQHNEAIIAIDSVRRSILIVHLVFKIDRGTSGWTTNP